MITKFITTRIESIARSAARRPRYAPAHPQLFRPRLTTPRGGHIAAVCFRLRTPPDLYFATHSQPEPLCGLEVQHQLKFRRPLNGEVGRRGATEDFVHL